MRFHIGFSKRINIKTFIQALGFIFVALCAFFGIDKITAHALTSVNPNGVSVNAYKPSYSSGGANDGWNNLGNGGTCSPTNLSGCSSKTSLYNSSGCNNQTSNGITYCMFANHNSSNYFSIANGINSGSNYMFTSPYVIQYGYYPQSKLVWKWNQSSVNYCSSGTLKLYYKWRFVTNNTALTTANLCATNLNSVTGSIGYCSNYVTVNGNNYSGTSEGDSTYSVIIPKPTTDLTITIDGIQPFLTTFTPEGQTTTGYYWNYGFAITGYECNATSSNTDSNAIINNASQNTQTIINNDNNNTQSINNNINNSASAIVDSIDDLKENDDNNTESINQSIQDGVNQIIDSSQVCNRVNIPVPVPGNFRGNLNLDTGEFESSSSTNMYTTDFIRYFKDELIKEEASSYTTPRICYYTKDKSYISCKRLDLSGALNVPENTYYFRFSYRKEGKPIISAIQCKNGNQSLHDTIIDETIPSIVPNDDFLSQNENNTIMELARYPINLINQILDAHESGVCSPLTLNLSSITNRWGGFNYTLVIPCVAYKARELIGEQWFNVFDLLTACILFYYFVMHLVERFELFTDGVDMFPGFFSNHIKQQYVDEKTGEVYYK